MLPAAHMKARCRGQAPSACPALRGDIEPCCWDTALGEPPGT